MSAVSLTRSYSLPLSGLSLPPSKVDKKDDRADRFSDFCIEQGIEQGLAYLKDQWTRGQHPFPSSFETLVSNPNYLSAWSTVVPQQRRDRAEIQINPIEAQLGCAHGILRLNAHQSRLLVLFHHENEFVMSYLAAWVAFEFGEMDVATVYGKQLIHFEDPESRLVTCFQPFVRVEGER